MFCYLQFSLCSKNRHAYLTYRCQKDNHVFLILLCIHICMYKHILYFHSNSCPLWAFKKLQCLKENEIKVIFMQNVYHYKSSPVQNKQTKQTKPTSNNLTYYQVYNWIQNHFYFPKKQANQLVIQVLSKFYLFVCFVLFSISVLVQLLLKHFYSGPASGKSWNSH